LPGKCVEQLLSTRKGPIALSIDPKRAPAGCIVVAGVLALVLPRTLTDLLIASGYRVWLDASELTVARRPAHENGWLRADWASGKAIGTVLGAVVWLAGRSSGAACRGAGMIGFDVRSSIRGVGGLS
jgi:hypothetical protein